MATPTPTITSEQLKAIAAYAVEKGIISKDIVNKITQCISHEEMLTYLHAYNNTDANGKKQVEGEVKARLAACLGVGAGKMINSII